MATTEAEKILESIHINIHSLRMMSGYKPSQFELKISYLISNHYADKCSECKAVIESKKAEAERQISGNVPYQDNKSIIGKVFGR